MENEDVILYGPRTGKHLRSLYPEIGRHPVLSAIKSDDLLFAWYMGIPNSPCDHDWAEEMRLTHAVSRSFTTKDKKDKYINRDYPDEVKQAIKIFEAMSPEGRLKAKLMTQRTFLKWEQMLNVDVDKDFLITRFIGKGEDREEIKEMDWTGRKQFIDSSKTIIQSLPEMLQKLEEGYGITEKQKKDEGLEENKAINQYHKNRQQEK